VAADKQAPGRPGAAPTWTTSAKAGVGTALSPLSPVWFTLADGALTEVYFPRVDRPCTRDLGLAVTGANFFAEEQRDTTSEVSYLAEGVPAYRLVNTCKAGRYRIEKIVLSDPARPVVLQQTRFTPRQGRLEDYSLYALLAPHLAGRGAGNTGWAGDYKGIPMLFTERDGTALALACTAPWGLRSAGFVGASDGRQDLEKHRRLTHTYERAEDGNVLLTAQIDHAATGGAFLLLLAFGRTWREAGRNARATLLDGFDSARDSYQRGWSEWLKTLRPLPRHGDHDLYKLSAAVIRCHEGKSVPSGIIASLSVPWGFARGDGTEWSAGYHLVWPRDLVESAGALLAAGAARDARRVLLDVEVLQEADGHWHQNLWLDGAPQWGGNQMDEAALVILLVGLLRRHDALNPGDLGRLWPMVRQAAAYLVRHGPVSGEDRWEEDAGYSPFTLAVEVAALLVAADLAEANDAGLLAPYLRETADAWNAAVERWIYVRGTDLARHAGVEGYYVRLAPPDEASRGRPAAGTVPWRNRPDPGARLRAATLVSPDALALVRFGLRAADDPRVVNTVRVLDATLKVDTPNGPAWHRYNGDGYGEHADGSPFDGTGIGRAWPLLAGERAHYELAAGRRGDAEALVDAMERFAGPGNLLPEQVWDTTDVPGRGLYFGKPSGSAMPLVWAHAEYVKLRRSLHEGRVFDMPPQTVERYVRSHTGSPYTVWRFNQKCRAIDPGQVLRVEVPGPAVVSWAVDGQASQEMPTRDSGWGLHVADLPTADLPAGSAVRFTFRWDKNDGRGRQEFEAQVADRAGSVRRAAGLAPAG
jgi:glucoamylase